MVLTNREHPVMIEPWDKGLLATTLHYPYEIRHDKAYFEDIPDLKLAVCAAPLGASTSCAERVLPMMS